MSKIIAELIYDFANRQFHKASINTERDLMCICSDFANEFLAQPLASRMTKEEKERVRKIRDMYYCKWRGHSNEATEAVYCAIKETLESIFGRELFEEEG